MENHLTPINNATRARINAVSAALLRLHKSLLDDQRLVYESVHGDVASPYEMLRIAMSDPQFAWLAKILSLIARLDEAAEVRRPASQDTAEELIKEAHALLNLETGDSAFAESFKRGLGRSARAKSDYEAALAAVTST